MIDVHGITPIWASIERWADTDTSVVDLSWFKEVDPPHRAGRGIRFRIGHRALHVGVMWPTRAKSELEVVGREVPATVDDISEWIPPEQGVSK